MTTSLSTTFSEEQLPSSMKWFREAKYVTRCSNGSSLQVFPNAKSDFWRKTYYTPTLIADSGNFLYVPVKDEKVVMETTFHLNNKNQFDQAGLVVRVDNECWIKTGLEAIDGVCSVGAVVTNVHSDWSCTPWSGYTLAVRIYKLGNSYVIESKASGSDTWNFFRICHLNHAPDTEVMMGLFCAAPGVAGMDAIFDYFTLKPTEGHTHQGL